MVVFSESAGSAQIQDSKEEGLFAFVDITCNFDGARRRQSKRRQMKYIQVTPKEGLGSTDSGVNDLRVSKRQHLYLSFSHGTRMEIPKKNVKKHYADVYVLGKIVLERVQHMVEVKMGIPPIKYVQAIGPLEKLNGNPILMKLKSIKSMLSLKNISKYMVKN
ncbi:hypothetical protein ABG067_007493 [Albugo candida]